MIKEVFKIPKIILHPKKDSSTTFSVRAHNDLLGQYDTLTRATGHSRNELINIAMKYFLDNVEVEPADTDPTSTVVRHKGRPPKKDK